MKWAWLLAALAVAGCSQPREPLATFRTVDGFTLTAQTGKEFRSEEHLAGKVWLADFIFTTCPGPCPRMTSQMSQIQKAVRDLGDVRLVSFTVDPDHDTPDVLAAYARRFGADPDRWFFLTGPMEALNHLSYDVFMLNKVDGLLDHSTRFVLVDRAGSVRNYYNTLTDFSVPDIVDDVRALLEEPAS